MKQVLSLYGLATSIAGAYTLTLSGTLTANRSWMLPDTAGTVALSGATQNVTFGTLGGQGLDGSWTVVNTADNTKVVAWSLAGMTTGKTLTIASVQSTSQTLTIPDIAGADTVATLAIANAFTAINTWSAVKNKMGGGAYSADDSIFLLRRDSAVVPNSHAVRDESAWTVATGGGGYCSFDSAASYAGASAFDHLHGFQGRSSYTGSATLVDLVGYWTQVDQSGSGTATNSKGLWIKTATGSGTITNEYGIFIESLTRGTNKYAILTQGSTPVYFGGACTVGANYTTAGTPVFNLTSAVAGDHGFTVRNTNSGTGSYAYFSMRNDATASVLFSSYSSGYTGTGFGLTLANYVALQAFGASNLGFILGTSANIPLIFGVNSLEVGRFTGGTLAAGSLAIKYTLDASNSTTASVTVAGGLAVAKAIIAGGKLSANGAAASSTLTGNTVAQVITWLQSVFT